ncbi:MAG: hypothetical protein AAF745_07095 [Planctomycetota bacterium]
MLQGSKLGKIIHAIGLTAVSIASARLTAAESPTLIDQAINDLAHASPMIRSAAAETIHRSAIDASADQWAAISQSLLRLSVDRDVDLQLTAFDLHQRARFDRQNRVLNEWACTNALFPTNEFFGAMNASWSHFASRAGDDADSRLVFVDLWLDDVRTVPEKLCVDLGMTSHGWHRWRTDFSSRLAESLKIESAAIWRHQSATARVARQLIENVVMRNPMRWSLEDRLHICWVHDCDEVARNLCRRVLDQSNLMPIEAATTFLAAERWGGILNREDWTRCLSDSRPLPIRPNQWHWIRHADARPDDGRSRWSRPHVQDVAIWAWMSRSGIDQRDAGMKQLKANPIWLIEPLTVGFLRSQDRQHWLAQADQIANSISN